MLEVTFYILSPDIELLRTDSTSRDKYPSPREYYACRLAEKAYRQGVYSIIYSDNEARSRLIDELLWTFRTASFVPHELYSRPSDVEAHQLAICNSFLPEQQNLTVINLTDRCPQALERCARVLEIVNADESSKQAGRQRYRQYQQLGATLKTHTITI